MKILVTGGCGYKGSLLIPKLLDDGHDLINIDTQWFGNSLKENPKLVNLKMDIRDLDGQVLENVDAVIHLAGFKSVSKSEAVPTIVYAIKCGKCEVMARILS